MQSRSRVTVDAIIEAAGKLFVKNGYANTTTNHIAEFAGVSVGSLYEYFPNKGSILAALLQWQVDNTIRIMRMRLDEARNQPLEVVVRAIARAGIEAHSRELELNRLLIAGMTREAHWRQMEKLSFSVAALMRDALAHLIADPVRLEHAAFTVETAFEALLHRTILFAHRLPAYLLEAEIAPELTGYMRPMCKQ